MKPEPRYSTDFARDSAASTRAAGREAVASRGSFRLCLCGGNTPRPVYEALARATDFPWPQTIITFGDERCVPPDDPQSNFGLADRSLLQHVPIPPENVLRMRGELEPAQAA